VAIKGSKAIHQNREEPRASANGRRWSARGFFQRKSQYDLKATSVQNYTANGRRWSAIPPRSSERGILAFSRDPSIHSDYILSPVFCILFFVSWLLVLEDLPC